MPPAATAEAHPNIAFIKYWGNRDHELRLPANGSVSMNLAGLQTRTRVEFDAGLKTDQLTINGKEATESQRLRVSAFLDIVRGLADSRERASVTSENNFPSGSGIASSSSAFAALAVAASKAAGVRLDERDLSRLARRGSGSASRSVPGGFVELRAGANDQEAYSISLAAPEHWALEDCIAIVSEEHKAIGSTDGHKLADSSPLQAARVADAERRLALCRNAIKARDFAALATVTELDNHLMHAVMMTSDPPLIYWQPASLTVMQAVAEWRRAGTAACYTLDAGANVHVICEQAAAEKVSEQLAQIPGVLRVLLARPGGAARLID